MSEAALSQPIIERSLSPHEQFKANLELLDQAGEVSAPFVLAYRQAVRLAPHLKDIVIRPPTSRDSSVAVAVPPWHTESGKPEIALPMSVETFSTAQSLMNDHPKITAILAEMAGIPLEDFRLKKFLQFGFLHELGHVDFYRRFKSAEDYDKFRAKEAAKLPLPGKRPSYLRSAEGRQFISDNWEAIQRQTGVASVEELVEIQMLAYRQMAHEAYADRFAAAMMRPKQSRRRVLSRLIFRR